LRFKHAQEVLARFRGQPDLLRLRDPIRGWADGLALHHRLEWGAGAIVARGIDPRVGGYRVGMKASQRRPLGAPAGHNRRAVVLPLELAQLPLPRQQPEWIVDARLQAVAHLGVAATGL
jgi:hypothetical protein